MSEHQTLWTVGHSTRSAEQFAELLKAHGVLRVADVRTTPGSRKFPHFGAAEMAKWVPAAGIAYEPFKELGGRRRARKDSINLGWRNESFRGYADYMQTPEFADGIERLIEVARQKPTVIMCAEAVPWRCHRSLIGDAMLVRGWTVMDIMSVTSAKAHALTTFAKVEGIKIVYPGEQTLFDSGPTSTEPEPWREPAPRKRGR
ncbi:MAG TPA: DUF488 domain-containing protein [Tepidisphaeraceae bacterium]|jgi:uncharacterized protein (DUF488 family)